MSLLRCTTGFGHYRRCGGPIFAFVTKTIRNCGVEVFAFDPSHCRHQYHSYCCKNMTTHLPQSKYSPGVLRCGSCNFLLALLIYTCILINAEGGLGTGFIQTRHLKSTSVAISPNSLLKTVPKMVADQNDAMLLPGMTYNWDFRNWTKKDINDKLEALKTDVKNIYDTVGSLEKDKLSIDTLLKV